MNLGETLRKARCDSGQSLIGVARALSYTNCALVQQIEKGRRHIPKNRIIDWAKIYNLDQTLLNQLNESWVITKKGGDTLNDDYNLMLILPWIVEVSPSKLSLRELSRIVGFVQNLDVPINKELLIGYIKAM